MYKKILLTLISAIIISIISFSLIILKNSNFISFDKPKDSEEHEINVEVGAPAQEMDDVEGNEKEEPDEYVNPFHQKYKQEEIEDEQFNNYIHKMSHQKVIADVKWGFYKITEERIDWLLESLETTKRKVPNKDVYKDILTRWKDGNFSEVDHDHNKVWKLQSGSIGKATGIMSEKEEKEYMENTTETTK